MLVLGLAFDLPGLLRAGFGGLLARLDLGSGKAAPSSALPRRTLGTFVAGSEGHTCGAGGQGRCRWRGLR